MPLLNRIKEQIKKTGPIPLSDFMEQVLYDPEYGYYYQKVPIGREGDYITAPEMTQAFGEAIAVWLIDIWQKAGCPTPFNLIEMGPGRGTLMTDMLRTFQSLTSPMPQMAVHLIEISPPLKELQQEALSSFPLSFQWHESLKTLPGGFSLIVGNEFWDALPTEQLINIGGFTEFIKRCVGLKDGQLVFLPEKPRTIYEMSQATYSVAADMRDYLKKNGGAALFLDYGYNEDRLSLAAINTLQAVFRHQRCSPLENLGQADLTHHVDFYSLKLYFDGLSVYGPIPQGDFLKAMGLETRTEQLCAKATPEQRGTLRTAAVRLTHPNHMGTLFKAMAVVSNSSFEPAGFPMSPPKPFLNKRLAHSKIDKRF